jgi:hypothetical protein
MGAKRKWENYKKEDYKNTLLRRPRLGRAYFIVKQHDTGT